jgi:PAS domain S-box-containing protein
MKAYDIELIYSRQLAESLALPVFIIDTEGRLLFYNESAEEILGRKYEETGEMPVEEWGTIFKPLDDKGNSLKPEDLPLVKTLNTITPAHGSFWIESLKGDNHNISVNSFPIVGRGGRFLGAVAIFWKLN